LQLRSSSYLKMQKNKAECHIPISCAIATIGIEGFSIFCFTKGLGLPVLVLLVRVIASQ
jgi:hypothetical protein